MALPLMRYTALVHTDSLLAAPASGYALENLTPSAENFTKVVKVL